MNCGSPAVTRVIACIAPDVRIENSLSMLFRSQAGFFQFHIRRVMTPFTIRTEHSYQALRKYAVERGNKVIRLNTHVEKPADNVDDVVCVYCRKHQVTR